MDWLKKHYEQAILIGATLILLACSGLVINSVFGFPEQFKDRNSNKPADNTIKPYPKEVLTNAGTRVDHPRNWNAHDGSLLISDPYVLKDGVLINPIESEIPLHPPISNKWIQQYDLPYWEGDLKDQDPDGDHFTNEDEFRAGTNPIDKNSVPPYWTKLRLLKFISKPFRLIFTGTPDDGETFTINAKDIRSRTQFLHLGDMIKDTPYKVLSYEKKMTTKDEIEIDVSELTIQNTETGQKLVLIANKEANDPTSYGQFINLIDNLKFTVKKDDEFSLSSEPDRKYKLIDISDKEALIEDQKTKEQHKILPAE